MTYQASKQEDRFHCWLPMVGLAKARPNNICNMYTYTEFDDEEGEGKERKTKRKY